LTREKKEMGVIPLSSYNLTPAQEGIVVVTKKQQLVVAERKIETFIKELKNSGRTISEQHIIHDINIPLQTPKLPEDID
jgi:hypothetical protein